MSRRRDWNTVIFWPSTPTTRFQKQLLFTGRFYNPIYSYTILGGGGRSHTGIRQQLAEFAFSARTLFTFNVLRPPECQPTI